MEIDSILDLSPDDIITQVTKAPSATHAHVIMSGVHSRATLLALADLLYIDADGRASATLRKAIVDEARS